MIKLKWNQKKIEDNTRMGALYCFKNCSANQN